MKLKISLNIEQKIKKMKNKREKKRIFKCYPSRSNN